MLVQHSIASEMSAKLQSGSEEDHRHLLQSSGGVSDDAVSSLPPLSHSQRRLLEGDGSPPSPGGRGDMLLRFPSWLHVLLI